MAEFFLMPQASPTMESGTLLAWKKPEGAELAPQDVIAEVETDKAAMDIEVFDKTVLLKILVAEGDDIPVDTPIAIIGDAGDDITALVAEFEAGVSAAADAPIDAAPPAPGIPAPEERVKPPTVAAVKELPAGWTGPTWEGKPLNDSVMELNGTFSVSGPVLRASPVARKMARDKGVDLASVNGSGPHGRITKADVESAGSRPVSGVVAKADEQVRNSKMRKLIASRLKESYLDAPAFFLTAVFDCDNLVAFRKQINAVLVDSRGIKVSYNDLTIAAVARALRDVPEANASWGEDAITRFGSVDVGVAVALPDGLITPIIRNADQKGLAALATETKELIGRARDRKLQPEEYTGATFSISNLGMMQIEEFTALINPPGSGILAIGALQQEPVVKDGALAIGWRMRVTMTCDHRVIDGALGARFLQAVRGYIEQPATLAV